MSAPDANDIRAGGRSLRAVGASVRAPKGFMSRDCESNEAGEQPDVTQVEDTDHERDQEIARMVEEGVHTRREIASHVGISEAAVTRAKHRLGLMPPKDTNLLRPYVEYAEEFTDAWTDAMNNTRIERATAEQRYELAERLEGEAEALARLIARVKAGDPDEAPTIEEPLRGLQHLGQVAVVGRDRILALAAEPVAYVWQDIAVSGTVVLIAGAPGDGKTTLLFLILAARANVGEAVDVLSRRVEPAPAGQWLVLIEGEHSESSTARKLLKSLALLSVDDDALNRVLIVARKAVTLGSPEWNDVRRLIAVGLVSDVAIDTVARVAPADPNDEREQVEVFSQLAAAIEQAPSEASRPIVWSVAHTRKNGNTGDLADVSGSVQRTGQADSVLLVKGTRADGRTVSTTVSFPKLREDPDDYPMPVTFAIESGVLRVDGIARDDRPLTARVLAVLSAGPLTKTALATRLGRNNADMEAAITDLFGQRAIQSVLVKVNGRERKGFAVTACGAPDEAPDEHK